MIFRKYRIKRLERKLHWHRWAMHMFEWYYPMSRMVRELKIRKLETKLAYLRK